MPKICAALGEQLPEDWQAAETAQLQPVEELILKLTDPLIQESDGLRRAAAMAELTYVPADHSRDITSRRYEFEAPLGPVELEEIRWYIESYFRWPTGVFKARALKTEQDLPRWGRALYDAALGAVAARAPLEQWRRKTGSRRFSIQVDADPPEGMDDDQTALAVELARWLVRSGRFQRAAFVSVEPQNVQDVKGVLDTIGRQLLPQYNAAQYGDDLDAALQPVERALRDFATLILVDNMESVLPDHQGRNPAGAADVTALMDLCNRLLAASDTGRLIFTSREPLPDPFASPGNTVALGRLSEPEAIQLVEQVMARHGWQPPPDDNAATPREVAELVQTVNCHPRALVLLAREVAKGVRATTRNAANLMALLDELGRQLAADGSIAERVIGLAGSIEQLLADLGRPQALDRAVALRQASAAAIPEWGKARITNEFLLMERLLQRGQLQAAYEKAHALLAKAQAAGPTAYKGADYDLAIAHSLLGRVLRLGCQAASALDLLIEAQRRFEALGDRAERMVSVTLTEEADCLTDLGRLDDAADKYEERIKLGEKLEDYRGVAVGKGQLATVQMLQGKYAEAVAGHEAARIIFERLSEPSMVATAWHQIGMVHQKAGHYDEAETAYLQSLEIETRTNDRAGQAISLNQLGNLYDDQLIRPEDAVTFYRQAVDIAVELGDLAKEGSRRSNIAHTTLKLKRFEEARQEILRSIECVR